MKKEIRVRYAPSPTGNLHLGGARTAIFNYLFAKHYNGKFIVRIEDTDFKRNQENKDKEQLENLRWLGMIPDESPLNPNQKYGPYHQSQRIELYHRYVKELLKKDLAYPCFCTEEELEQEKKLQLKKGIKAPKYSGKCRNLSKNKIDWTKKHTIRFKTNYSKQYGWNDGVRGFITVEGKALDDWVILKANKIPTYNFAVAIDDHLMEITDVLRGEEHISNTPKQLQVYEAFNWEKPEFYHLTILIGKDGKKLSKRDESAVQFIEKFRDLGFLPEAVFNFLALLGFSPRGEKEIFSKEELIKVFDKNRFSSSPSNFNFKKLLWIDNYYFKNLPDEKYFEILNSFYTTKQLNKTEKQFVFKLFQPQLEYGMHIQLLGKLFIETPMLLSDMQKSTLVTNKALLNFAYDSFKKLSVWKPENIRKIFKDLEHQTKQKGRKLMYPLRLAITRREVGPDLVSICYVFGKKKTLERIKEFIN